MIVSVEWRRQVGFIYMSLSEMGLFVLLFKGASYLNSFF